MVRCPALLLQILRFAQKDIPVTIDTAGFVTINDAAEGGVKDLEHHTGSPQLHTTDSADEAARLSKWRNKKAAAVREAAAFLLLIPGCQVGLEPTTFGTTIRHSNQLNYWHHIYLGLQR